jgi:hypothetical protein
MATTMAREKRQAAIEELLDDRSTLNGEQRQALKEMFAEVAFHLLGIEALLDGREASDDA